MTEAEWLTTTDSNPLLEFLEGKATNRKYLLTALHVCRTRWNTFPLSLFWTALAICDRQVEERSSPSEMNRLLGVFVNRFKLLEIDPSDAARREKRNVVREMLMIVDTVSDLAFGRVKDIGLTVRCLVSADDGEQARVIRDIFGNPFRPVPVDPCFLTSTVVTLARQIYESRDFSAMPILADALQDAGCNNADLLSHLRGDGPHVRGCWALDGVLGKSSTP